jgi:hypothetical protein
MIVIPGFTKNWIWGNRKQGCTPQTLTELRLIAPSMLPHGGSPQPYMGTFKLIIRTFSLICQGYILTGLFESGLFFHTDPRAGFCGVKFELFAG